jgi:hypothetical protein
MSNLNGKELIEALSKRLKFEAKELCDANILTLLRSLNEYEVNELVTFGDCEKWISERIDTNYKDDTD